MTDELILIVEDVDLLRDGLREILVVEGFRVATARNGKDALERMNQQAPALIISDITMPVMDGYDFYSAVRARPDWVAIPFIFLTARTDSSDFLTSRNLGVDDYLTKPISRDELVTTVRSRLSRFNQAQMGRVQQAYLDSLVALANAIESRSFGAAGHVERLTTMVMVLAGELGWSAKRLKDLRFAAILHDIGKIHIPAALLFKAGPLTPEEWNVVRRHPVTGAEMLKDVAYLVDCIPFVRHHHERWDGCGYPDGLAGSAIPDGARMLAIADSLDAMTASRPYAQAMSIEAACTEIERLAGQNYDPDMAPVFVQACREGHLHAALEKTKAQG
jgi:putative two-component system response regulator